MSDPNQDWREATVRTSGDLMTIARSMQLEELSSLSLPEIERLSNEIARVVPAGNVPGIILSGLARLNGRTVETTESRKYIELLFRGVRQTLDRASYITFFAGPAAAIYAYQQILKLAGQDPNATFPEGTWQFYLEFALREDSARHANETTGFHGWLAAERDTLSEADQLAAWLLTVVTTVRQLPDLLANEWRERVILKTLAEVAQANKQRRAEELDALYPQWEKMRPYGLPPNALSESFASYRRRTFDQFWTPYYEAFSNKAARHFDTEIAALEASRLHAYRTQMSWLAYLDPGTYSDRRVAYPLELAQVGVIWQGRYYFLPILEITDAEVARKTAAAILGAQPKSPPATLDDALVTTPREEQAALRKNLDDATLKEINFLRHTPVLINWDMRDARHPLANIRRGKRGIGDHALTIMRTGESVVFDQSHIFFDGAWGAAVAQIMTSEATAWARSLLGKPSLRAGKAPYSPVLQAPPKLVRSAGKAHFTLEVGAESTAIDLNAIRGLRQLLRQRSEYAQITVNDLFILYRGLHATLYQPSLKLIASLEKLAADNRPASQAAYQSARDAITRLQNKNPAILIPIDAARFDPKERIYPTTFRNPITDFWQYHQNALAALQELEDGGRKAQARFEEARGNYLRMIGGFGELLKRYRDIALRGESISTASIRFLAKMHGSIRKLLDSIPGRFDLLNEVIKGEEVFSNTGRVARGSSLRRFISAKDDNQGKTLVWGAQTDDQNIVHLSLRDFRPHVRLLGEAGQIIVAQMMAQDYLDAYCTGLNNYVADLRQIITAGSETRAGQRGLFG